jgi:hypothetical protein
MKVSSKLEIPSKIYYQWNPTIVRCECLVKRKTKKGAKKKAKRTAKKKRAKKKIVEPAPEVTKPETPSVGMPPEPVMPPSEPPAESTPPSDSGTGSGF